MNSSIVNLFGPMDSNACDYFFYLSLIGLIMFTFSCIFSMNVILFAKDKKLASGTIAFALTNLIMYFSNRLLYNMCLK